MDFAAKPLRKARETYRMHELRTIFPYGLNDRIGDEFKTDNKHINVAAKFSSFPRKYSRANCGKNNKTVPRLLPQQFVKDLNQMLNTSIKDATNFIRISISSMKKSYLKITHQLLSTKLCDSPPDLIFSIYYHQAIDFIESKIDKLLTSKSKKKPLKNVCSIFFENKGVEFINIARILCDPDIVKSLPSSSVQFPTPMVTYKLTPPISTKFFNFNKFVHNLNLDLFLTNPDSLPCKCNNSPFVDKYHKHMVTGDLRIIKNNALRKLFIKGPKYREVRPINLEKAKRCILEGLHNGISSWCYKTGVDKSFILEWTNNVKVKIDERMSHLTNTLYTNKRVDCLSSPEVKNALDNIHKDFVVVPIDKATGNIAFVCKKFYTSVITRELGLNNNSSPDTYKNVGGLSANDIIDGNIKDLKIKFGIDNIPIENHRLPNMYWMPKMHKNPIKARFIIVTPKSSIKPLARTIT